VSGGAVVLTIDVPAAVRKLLDREGEPLGDLMSAEELAFLTQGGYAYLVGPHPDGAYFARVKRKGCELVGVDPAGRS